MTAQLIDGRTLAKAMKEEMAVIVKEKTAKGLTLPGLAVILVGEDPASEIYVRNKRQACEQTGITSFDYNLNADVKQEELLSLIDELNQNKDVHGILLQLPLPKHIDAELMLEQIAPEKDVDGFHAYNLGRLAQRRPLIRPCTPLGVMLLLESIKQPFKEKHAVVIGASNIVGRPMALELLIAGSTVTVCHRFTKDISDYVKQADILVSAVGKPKLIDGNWIKPGSTVVDVGMNRMPDGTLCGDIDFNIAKDRAAWITPVPGGVGPMTVTALMRNTLKAAGYIE